MSLTFSCALLVSPLLWRYLWNSSSHSVLGIIPSHDSASLCGVLCTFEHFFEHFFNRIAGLVHKYVYKLFLLLLCELSVSFVDLFLRIQLMTSNDVNDRIVVYPNHSKVLSCWSNFICKNHQFHFVTTFKK